MIDLDLIRKALTTHGDELALQILSILLDSPTGVTRARLVAVCFPTGFTNITSDRNVRRAIKRLRDMGLVILSSPDKAGYRIAGSDETKLVRAYALREYKAALSRIATTSKVLRAYGLKDNLRMSLGG